MPHPRLDSDAIAQRGKEIYEQKLRAHLETSHLGQFLIIDVETGDYETDTEAFSASRRAHSKHPEGAFFGMRIGQRSSGTLGASASGIGR